MIQFSLDSRIRQVTLFASIALFAGCGSEPPINDTAETTRPEGAKPAPSSEPTQTPETTPAKDGPKG
jgi:hypothetical protein